MSDSFFDKAFNSSASIIMGISTIEGGVYIDVNEAFLKITGYSRDEVVGKSSVSLGIVNGENREIMRRSLLETGRIENFELNIVTKNKKNRCLMCFAEIISVDGEQELLTIAHDVTDLNAAKSELEKEQALLKAVFESTPDAFIIKDLNSVYQKANPAFCRFAGITEAQAVGKTDFDFFPESEAIKYCAEDQEIIKTGLTKEFDRNFRSQNGLVWCQTIKTPVRDSNGLISGVLCAVRDISRKKRFEELLNSRLCISNYSFSSSLPDLFQKVLSESERLTESQFSFFHFVDDINKMIHLNTWSEKAVKICNMKTYEKSYSLDKAGVCADCFRIRQPVIHNDYPNLEGKKGLPPGHAHISRELAVPVFEGEKIVAILGVGNKSADYNQTDVEVVSELAKMAWDILGRKEAERKFSESQRILKTLIDNLPGIVFRCSINADMLMNIKFISDGCKEITGYIPDEFTASSFNYLDFVHPDDCNMVAVMISDFFNNKEPYEVQFRIIHKNKSIRWIWGRGIVVSSKEGTSVTVEGFGADITELRRKDSELRLFASAIHQVAETIVITDTRGIIKYVNPSFEKITGYSSLEAIGAKPCILKSGEHGESFYHELRVTPTFTLPSIKLSKHNALM